MGETILLFAHWDAFCLMSADLFSSSLPSWREYDPSVHVVFVAAMLVYKEIFFCGSRNGLPYKLC